MKIKELNFKGVYEVVFNSFEDERGSFTRTYDEALFLELGIPIHWVQENHSRNKTRGTIRGLHFLLHPDTDGKLIRCTRGKVLDFVVDLRKGSSTFGSWISVELFDSDNKCLYIPKGFAHGYCTLTDNAELIYKHDSFYRNNSDSGIVWNDKYLNIPWPVKGPIISEKDKRLMTFHEFVTKYISL